MQAAGDGLLRALAAGDFGDVADSFANAGFVVRVPGRGILQLRGSNSLPARTRLLLSVGIHGDETAPIEMLAQLLAEFAKTPHDLAVDLMVVVGNPAAIAQSTRFVDADLNRMFRSDRSERGDLQQSVEAARADAIMRATAGFFRAREGEQWHLDLHTAIRPSRYPAFAVVPDVSDGVDSRSILAWLGQAGIEAAILSRSSAGTFSAYSAVQFGARSATLELGQIGALGSNELGRFAATHSALDRFLREGRPASGVQPRVFCVRQELIKCSNAFQMNFGRDTANFTPLPPGSLIAQDGDTVYRVGEETEYVVFPNPDVRIGLRAGLTVVEQRQP